MKLSDYVTESEIGLPSETCNLLKLCSYTLLVAIEKDVKASFSPVMKAAAAANQKESILKIRLFIVNMISHVEKWGLLADNYRQAKLCWISK